MLSPEKNNRFLFILHLTVLVWGFTGILGALITVSSVHLVWYRVLIASVSLFVYFKAVRFNIKISRDTFIKLFFTGAILAAHWVLFFQSIKSSTVSVTLVCLSSITLFTAVLEPLTSGKKISKLQILTGLLIICGIIMIFKFETQYTLGITLGLISAFCASCFSIINSRQVKNRPAAIISFYELISAFIWISAYMLLTGGFNAGMRLSVPDMIYLFILGTVCTSVAYVAGIAVMQQLTPFTVALVTNLEPVYGIVLAFIIFGQKEHMTSGFYIGTLIILLAIFLFPLARKTITKRHLRKYPPIV